MADEELDRLRNLHGRWLQVARGLPGRGPDLNPRTFQEADVGTISIKAMDHGKLGCIRRVGGPVANGLSSAYLLQALHKSAAANCFDI